MKDMGRTGEPIAVPELCVSTANGTEVRFSRSFHVGRDDDCEVVIDDAHVSRKHVAVSFHDGRWSFQDLQSSNGVFVNGRRVAEAPIEGAVSLRLGGTDGPLVTLHVDRAAAAPTRRSSTQHAEPAGAGETKLLANYAERYFGAPPGDGRWVNGPS